MRPARVRVQRGADLRVRELRERRDVVDGKRDGAHDEIVGRLRHDGRRDARRQLEHERAGVVGDAPEQVQSPGRATPTASPSISSARTGPMRDASVRFAYPTHMTGVVVSSGASSGPPHGSVATPPASSSSSATHTS